MTDAADTPDAADATDPPATVAGAVRDRGDGDHVVEVVQRLRDLDLGREEVAVGDARGHVGDHE
ncbi:hypothetical protein DOU01_16220, partial [Clavibacter michiganensis subsp. michiganensis]|uniref:hypothetical protein n=1 Tax=Clavibacter michiganensis TaxID=28447 RepID=UPI00136646ED